MVKMLSVQIYSLYIEQNESILYNERAIATINIFYESIRIISISENQELKNNKNKIMYNKND